MRRKYGKLRKKENLIVFPGTFENLVEKGHAYVELAKFDKAVEAFDQAIKYEPDYTEFLGPYAIALYETKNFQRAKEITGKLLQSGADNYINVIELYLAISIQLEEYEEVEMTIDTLLDEGIVPHELLNKFNYLRELNDRLSKRYAKDNPPVLETLFTLEEFVEMNDMAQQHALASIEGANLTGLVPVLVAIVERHNLSPLVITFALTLLHQANYLESLTVRKYGEEMIVTPAELSLPGKDDKTADVLSAIERELVKDPSRFDLARSLVEKYCITAYPFTWGKYNPTEIAKAYLQYIDSLFTGEKIPDTPLCNLIQRTDIDSDVGKV